MKLSMWLAPYVRPPCVLFWRANTPHQPPQQETYRANLNSRLFAVCAALLHSYTIQNLKQLVFPLMLIWLPLTLKCLTRMLISPPSAVFFSVSSLTAPLCFLNLFRSNNFQVESASCTALKSTSSLRMRMRLAPSCVSASVMALLSSTLLRFQLFSALTCLAVPGSTGPTFCLILPARGLFRLMVSICVPLWLTNRLMVRVSLLTTSLPFLKFLVSKQPARPFLTNSVLSSKPTARM